MFLKYDPNLDILELISSNLNLEFDISFEEVESDNSKKNSLMVLSNKQGGFKLICQRVFKIKVDFIFFLYFLLIKKRFWLLIISIKNIIFQICITINLCLILRLRLLLGDL